MKASFLKKFQDTLQARQKSIVNWFSAVPDNKKELVCCSDDTKDITLERLDTLPVIDDTIRRIEENSFGTCKICSGEIDTERLELDCTSDICLDHFTDEQRRHLEKDLEMASKIQKQLLPSNIPSLEGLDIAADYQSKDFVGGDYFDFFQCSDSGFGLVIADVMGKGLAAGLLMSNLQATIRILGPESENLNDLAKRINELFRYNTKLISFISLFLAKINKQNNLFQFCNAGHNSPLFWNASTKTIYPLRPTGPAIGLMHNPQYRTDSINFQSGDIILLYTDGIIEARNACEKEFGTERLKKLLRSNSNFSSKEIIKVIKDDLSEFIGKKLSDDSTMIIVKKD